MITERLQAPLEFPEYFAAIRFPHEMEVAKFLYQLNQQSIILYESDTFEVSEEVARDMGLKQRITVPDFHVVNTECDADFYVEVTNSASKTKKNRQKKIVEMDHPGTKLIIFNKVDLDHIANCRDGKGSIIFKRTQQTKNLRKVTSWIMPSPLTSSSTS